MVKQLVIWYNNPENEIVRVNVICNMKNKEIFKEC